jgi:hypothetical protein
MDLMYVGIVVVFFAATWGLLKVCDILGEQKSGDRS